MASRPTTPRKTPLLRLKRVQFCLKEIGFYKGELHGRATEATLTAMAKFRTQARIAWVAGARRHHALHAEIWRRCRPIFEARIQASGLASVGSGDRRPADSTTTTTTTESSHLAEAAAAIVTGAQPLASGTATTAMPPAPPMLPAPPVSGPLPPSARRACLTTELREQLLRAQGQRREIETCELPCLPQPPHIAQDDARHFERKHAITWCKTCIPVSVPLPVDDIVRIEKAGGITLCGDPRAMQQRRAAMPSLVVEERLTQARALFGKSGLAAIRHDGIAIVIAMSRSTTKLAPKPVADRDAAIMAALLVERLGYRGDNVIELRNPTRADLDLLVGTGQAKGKLAERLQASPGASLLVYVSGWGAITGEDGEAYLMPAGAVPGRESQTALPVEAFYQALARLGARTTTAILEVGFARDATAPVLSPNGPETRIGTLPRLALRGLTVMTATDRDQRPLEDSELAISLFTRHLVEALAGAADVAPIGNGDGVVDTAEAFALAAWRTAFAARKSLGLLQRPMMSHGRAQPLIRFVRP